MVSPKLPFGYSYVEMLSVLAKSKHWHPCPNRANAYYHFPPWTI